MNSSTVHKCVLKYYSSSLINSHLGPILHRFATVNPRQTRTTDKRHVVP